MTKGLRGWSPRMREILSSFRPPKEDEKKAYAPGYHVCRVVSRRLESIVPSFGGSEVDVGVFDFSITFFLHLHLILSQPLFSTNFSVSFCRSFARFLPCHRVSVVLSSPRACCLAIVRYHAFASTACRGC
jgi:hypothetical protein